MNLLGILLKALPFILLFVTLSGVVLTITALVRFLRQKTTKSTVVVGVIGLILLIVSAIAWNSVFSYLDSF